MRGSHHDRERGSWKNHGEFSQYSRTCVCYFFVIWGFVFLIVLLISLCIAGWKLYAAFKTHKQLFSFREYLEHVLASRVKNSLEVYLSDKTSVQTFLWFTTRICSIFAFPLRQITFRQFCLSLATGHIELIATYGSPLIGIFFYSLFVFLHLFFIVVITKQQFLYSRPNVSERIDFTTEERIAVVRSSAKKTLFYFIVGCLVIFAPSLPNIIAQKGRYSSLGPGIFVIYFNLSGIMLLHQLNRIRIYLVHNPKFQARQLECAKSHQRIATLSTFLMNYNPCLMIKVTEAKDIKEFREKAMKLVPIYLSKLEEEEIGLVTSQNYVPTPKNIDDVSIITKIYITISFVLISEAIISTVAYFVEFWNAPFVIICCLLFFGLVFVTPVLTHMMLQKYLFFNEKIYAKMPLYE